ncbi:hypothetical protein [Lysinibacillus sp. RS5]|uniref:hypothetical protein n=1 Tax=unclassified Lysinibacillus TaxID=2636778 RepID=UPI0035BE690A
MSNIFSIGAKNILRFTGGLGNVGALRLLMLDELVGIITTNRAMEGLLCVSKGILKRQLV